ncbi:type II toxin-antitoxin system Phd/YefM family antitoxin [Candidatus Gottesmanbacteria bacterium]|nr:type II toxin-antitoxin system Phd/YefM family antitoxin [Candidatus Gottesmanbacteria bacterium]MBI3443744.1 type II toxin-antitoxin system Phd/YefM family antitoxin [Candidatus Woesebacteria bacterium]
MTYVIPVTHARRDLLKLVDKVDEEYTRIDLTKNGKVKATLVSPEYLDSMEETIYTLGHSMDDIREAQEEIKRGEYVTLEELIEELNARKKLHRIKKSQKKDNPTSTKRKKTLTVNTP